jgi:non-canonical (house-cleaning) NTP pyrophosphatase
MVNAEPLGLKQTTRYARLRLREMQRQHGPCPKDGLDIAVESGAIDGQDIAIVVIHAPGGSEFITMSRGVAFPGGVLEEAKRRGLKHTTASDIIHEQWPDIPADDWQWRFPGGIPRQQQICEAVVQGLRQLDS